MRVILILALIITNQYQILANPPIDNGSEYGPDPLTSSGGCHSALIRFVDLGSSGPRFVIPINDINYEKIKLEEAESSHLRSITSYITCHGGSPFYPRVTSLHFMEENKNGNVCYWERSCGNLKSWSGQVAVSGAWSQVITFGEIMSSLNSYRVETEVKSYGLNLTFGINWKETVRYCKEPSTKICA